MLVFFAHAALASTAQRSLEVQWETEPEAVKYIVEIRYWQGKFLKTFSTKDPLFKFRAPVGNYEIRARIEVKSGNLGPWSEWEKLQVPPEPVAFGPEFSESIKAKPAKGRLAAVDLKWGAVGTAQRYRLKILDRDGRAIAEKITRTPNAKIELPPGEYGYSVTSMGAEGLNSDEVRSPQAVLIGNAIIADIKMKPGPSTSGSFEWETVAGLRYKATLERSAFLSAQWNLVFRDEVLVQTGSWKAAEGLPPGRYRWTLVAEQEGWTSSAPVTREFEIKPKEPQLSGLDKELDAVWKE